MSLAGWRASSLHRYGKYHLANRRTINRPLQAARLIDELDQVELLGDPHQSPHVTDSLRPDGSCRSQIGYRRRIRRTQYGLSGEWSLTSRVPYRLGRDPVPTPSHLALKYIYSFI